MKALLQLTRNEHLYKENVKNCILFGLQNWNPYNLIV
jgi:hypothetical protein